MRREGSGDAWQVLKNGGDGIWAFLGWLGRVECGRVTDRV